jgi:hypothetical protein
VAARFPNGNPEHDQSNYHQHAAGWLAARDFGVAAVHTSNYTRPGSFGEYSVGVGGPAANFAGNLSYWAQPHPGGGGASTYSIMSGVEVHTGPGQLPALQQGGGPGGYVFMMQTGSWGSWVFSIGSSTPTDPATNTTNLTFSAGGFQEARGTGSPKKGGGSFYASHRRELLDSIGEFWHDTEKQELYLVVPNEVAEQQRAPAAAAGPRELFLPQVAELFRLAGTKAAPVVGVAIVGLTVRHTRPTYMEPYTVPSGGDYAVHKGGAVHLNGTLGCAVQSCVFDQLGGNAVALSDWNRNATVRGNEMKRLGENGIVLVGTTDFVDGVRNVNQPRHCLLEANLIHHVGLYTKQSCAIFNALACENTYRNNILFHGPRALYNQNDAFGGNTVLERNLFFGAVLETKDHGPYSHGR